MTTEVATTNATEQTTTEEHSFDDYTQRLVIGILQCVISAVGILGNTVVILTVILSKRLQTRTNFFVVNLALADLLTCLTLPFQAYSILQDKEVDLQHTPTISPFHAFGIVCKAVATLMWLGVGTSIISLALIAVVRLYVITKSRQTYTRVFRCRNLFLLAFLAWLVPFLLLFLPPQFDVGEVGYSHRFRFCSTNSEIKSHDMYSIINGIAIPVPCFVVIVICYTRIYLFVRKVSLDVVLMANSGPCDVRTPTTPRTTLEIALFRRQVKVAKNLFIVICAFVLCVTPLGITISLPMEDFDVLPWTFTFFCISCCINPIIYGLKHPQFQEVLCLQFRRRSWRRSPERQPLIRP